MSRTRQPTEASQDPRPEPSGGPCRRNRSRQRERLWDELQNRADHPTAAQLFESLLGEFPRLSLGTVYRNLEVLISEGRAVAVPSESGAMRYDGNPVPHHHFVCKSCDRIQDLELRLPAELTAQVAREYDVVAERARVDFYGLCSECRQPDAEPQDPSPWDGSRQKPGRE